MDQKEYEVTFTFTGTFSLKVEAESKDQAEDYVFNLHKQDVLAELFRQAEEHDSECAIVEVK